MLNRRGKKRPYILPLSLFNLYTFFFGFPFRLLQLYRYKVKCPVHIPHFCPPCDPAPNKLTQLKSPTYPIFLSPLFFISFLYFLLPTFENSLLSPTFSLFPWLYSQSESCRLNRNGASM